MAEYCHLCTLNLAYKHYSLLKQVAQQDSGSQIGILPLAGLTI